MARYKQTHEQVAGVYEMMFGTGGAGQAAKKLAGRKKQIDEEVEKQVGKKAKPTTKQEIKKTKRQEAEESTKLEKQKKSMEMDDYEQQMARMRRGRK